MELTDKEALADFRVAATRFADIRRAIGKELTEIENVKESEKRVVNSLSW